MYIDPFVIRSINRSELRKRILLYLNEIYPSSTYLAEIARVVKSDPSNVKGALIGLGNRYNGSSSLVSLGLVEIVERDGFKYYRLTDYGKKVVELLKSYHLYYSRFM
ncbi:helix-turn-helix domain-containing protein [Thermococcus sp.]